MDKYERKLLKKEYNKAGWTIFGQEITLNVVAVGVTLFSIIAYMLINHSATLDDYEKFSIEFSKSGIYMIIAVLIAFFPVFILRGKKFFTYDLVVKKKSISFKVILASIIVILSLNFLAGFISSFLEYLLNLIGFTSLSVMDYFNDNDSITMIVYACIVAPIMEEFFYRGAILRHLDKYGSKFAIIATAVMFGCMHGNLVQIPNGILAGLVLGYLAEEYSIKLSIIVHMANNIFAQGINGLYNVFNDSTVNLIYFIFVLACLIISIIMIIKNRKRIKLWLINNKIEKGMLKYYFTSVSIIIILILNFLTCLISIEKL